MPAAAVIPAPIAYIKVVAVKKLVVGLLRRPGGLPQGCTGGLAHPLEGGGCPLLGALSNSGSLL